MNIMQELMDNEQNNKGMNNIIVLHKEGNNVRSEAVCDYVDNTKAKITLALVEMKGNLAKVSFRKSFDSISEVKNLILYLKGKGIKFLAAKEDGKIIHDLNEFIGLDTFLFLPDAACEIIEELALYNNAQLVEI